MAVKTQAHKKLILLDTLLEDKIHCIYNVCETKMRFDWDKQKAESNEQKHGVSFEEARTVFYGQKPHA